MTATPFRCHHLSSHASRKHIRRFYLLFPLDIMADVSSTLSGLFGGSYLNAMVYTLEIVQLASYIKHFWKRDKLPIKILVISCFLIDTLCTIAVFAWILLCSVVHWGDQAYLAVQSWPSPVYVVCTTAVATLAQSFLISRFFILSSQPIITLILGIFTLTALAGGISVAVILIHFASYADRDKLLLTAIIWLGSTALADLLIMIFFVLTLTRTASRAKIRSTKALIKRLVLFAIQSGTVTTILALLTLSIFLTKPMSNDSAYFSLSIGRVYTLTMLFNLNLRKGLQSRCYTCEMNTFGGVINAAPQREGSKSLQVQVEPVEQYCLHSVQLRSSGQPGLDQKEPVSTEGATSKESQVYHTSNAFGAI